MEPEDDNLPAIKIPELPEITQESPHTAIIKSDLQIAHMQLIGLKQAWENVSSIAQITKLVPVTIQAVKFRRDVMGMPYGYLGNGSKRDDFTPLD